ncbi:MAG TPA: hypothetical protein VGM50_20365, partial [Gemmatimonadaceae bacterium]
MGRLGCERVTLRRDTSRSKFTYSRTDIPTIPPERVIPDGRHALRLTTPQAGSKFKGCLRLQPIIEQSVMAIPATQIRRGMVIVFEGDPCRITEFRHHTPG